MSDATAGESSSPPLLLEVKTPVAFERLGGGDEFQVRDVSLLLLSEGAPMVAWALGHWIRAGWVETDEPAD